jgi:transposase
MSTLMTGGTTYSAGIDLHKSPLRLHVVDAAGTTVCQQTITRDKRRQLRTALAPFGKDVTVGVESTYNWYWVADELRRQGIPCVLGHARDVHAQRQGKHKSDAKDAANMSQMVRMGTFPAAYACLPEWRATRDLLRKRLRLVEERTQHMQHSGCVADQYLLGENPMTAAGYERAVIADVDKALDIDLKAQEMMTTLIDSLDKWILERAKISDKPLYELLTRTRGIGPVLALTLMYETIAITRFTRAQQYASYCRTANPEYSSAGKRLGPGDRKRGNPYLCRALHMLAVQSIKLYPEVKAFHRATVKRKGRRTARRILAHKWALAIYYMWKRREPFEITKFLGTAYAPRAQSSH